MDLLFTSVGKRTYLLRWFRAALSSGDRILGADLDPNAPALGLADEVFVVPEATSPDYPRRILEISEERKPRAIIPLSDWDLIALPRHYRDFIRCGVSPLFPKADMALATSDKLRTAELLASHEIPHVPTATSLDGLNTTVDGYVVKPRFGSGSLAVRTAMSAYGVGEALKEVQSESERSTLNQFGIREATHAVVQPLMQTAEYGMDVVADLNGRFRGAALKQKIAMTSGETCEGISVPLTEKAEKLARKLSTVVGHKGVLDVDLFETDTGFAVLELNPRFGGGYPFSHVAGMDVISPLVAWLKGELGAPVPPARPGVRAVKEMTELGVFMHLRRTKSKAGQA